MGKHTEHGEVGDDHISEGIDLLKKFGRSLDSVIHASFGHSESGAPQVLVFGSSYVEILNGDGDQLLEVGDRDIRGLRLVEGSGIELCISREWVFKISSLRWMHRIQDRDAQYLEEFWINWTPIIESGAQLTPIPWREEEYARYVGRIITESARCEMALAALASLALELMNEEARKIFTAVGDDITKILKRAARGYPSIRGLADRYSALKDERNFVAHGVALFNTPDPSAGSVVKFRRVSNQDGRELELPEFMNHTFNDLARLANDINDLANEARISYVNLKVGNDY